MLRSRSSHIENQLSTKRVDFIRMCLKRYRDEMHCVCPCCGHLLQYSAEASCQLDKLILRCAGHEHHTFQKDIDYSKFYHIIPGGKAA